MIDFKDLAEKEFYIIKFKHTNENSWKQLPNYGIAQLTKIQVYDNDKYAICHFKHNKHEYLYYIGKFNNMSYNDIEEITSKQEYVRSPKEFDYHNSRIMLHNLDKDEFGYYKNAYWPKGYKPGCH